MLPTVRCDLASLLFSLVIIPYSEYQISATPSLQILSLFPLYGCLCSLSPIFCALLIDASSTPDLEQLTNLILNLLCDYGFSNCSSSVENAALLRFYGRWACLRVPRASRPYVVRDACYYSTLTRQSSPTRSSIKVSISIAHGGRKSLIITAVKTSSVMPSKHALEMQTHGAQQAHAVYNPTGVKVVSSLERPASEEATRPCHAPTSRAQSPYVYRTEVLMFVASKVVKPSSALKRTALQRA
ncbi:uncharacterized protein K452DRAFT_308912 [Aplosporella prunicola CBS 121167]|uniref:Uncharacterized protein n=1 Tax=Aplosporella prunicola CBS 121167 TaxID=1176127 RepID=A0A6A6BCK0_9PEZI|nr:uncharacterized protein K452DRAFT_308912 [Aplosporella prunicola CBS 121167]KAF2141860.1 hypothetical protein K452DRAFT_308912 [Aplosporella prunicola CBS 121167]